MKKTPFFSGQFGRSTILLLPHRFGWRLRLYGNRQKTEHAILKLVRTNNMCGTFLWERPHVSMTKCHTIFCSMDGQQSKQQQQLPSIELALIPLATAVAIIATVELSWYHSCVSKAVILKFPHTPPARVVLIPFWALFCLERCGICGMCDILDFNVHFGGKIIRFVECE